MHFYFAYGSNMNWEQMQARCPSARFVCRALLKDHRLAFTRFSKNRNAGVADLLATAGENVWGVVYELSDGDLEGLDLAEGYRYKRTEKPNSYYRDQAVVYQDGDETQALTAEIYFVHKKGGPFLPSRDYMDVLLTGARRWSLPPDYLAGLEKIQVKG
jgi:gamma-glutamylcyclotransferase (GGCT)/AIG2-like uncharacterized protein YtfP